MAADAELQAWWVDVRRLRHGDRQRDLACWLELDTVANLAESLSTLVWIASVLSVSTATPGSFPTGPPAPAAAGLSVRAAAGLPGGWRSWRPSRTCRFFLDTVPDHFTIMLGLTLIEVLSNHTSDELYLGQCATAAWTDDG